MERIEKAIDDGWLQIARLSPKEKKTAQRILSKSRLDGGEAESIDTGASRKLIVIIDDREARSFAEAMGVQFCGTAGMPLRAFVGKHLRLDQLDDVVQELSKTMWLAPAVVAEILKNGSGNEEMKKEQMKKQQMVGTRLPETIGRDLEAIEEAEQSDRSTTVRNFSTFL